MIYAICNQKGGTGKTTTTAALAQAAVYRGKTALAVDLDAQGNLTYALKAETGEKNSQAMLHGALAADMIQTTPQGVDVIAAAWELSIERTGQGSARRLQNALKRIKKAYDAIFIDTPPNAGELQYNALQAADRYIIPLRADAFSLQGLYQTLATVRAVRENNKELKPAGYILTQYSGRTNLERHFAEVIQQQAEALGVPFLGRVRPAVVVGEAEAFQESLFDSAPKSNPVKDYLAIFDKLNI